MKKLLFVVLFVSYMFGLDSYSTLPSDEKAVVNKLETILGINQSNAYRLFKVHFKVYLEDTENWTIHWIDNTDPANDALNESSKKTAFMTILTDDRIINMSIVKYPNIKVLFIYNIETLPRPSAKVLAKFEKLKNDSKFVKKKETKTYAYFKESGYMSYVNILVKDGAGAIQYVDAYTFKLK